MHARLQVALFTHFYQMSGLRAVHTLRSTMPTTEVSKDKTITPVSKDKIKKIPLCSERIQCRCVPTRYTGTKAEVCTSPRTATTGYSHPFQAILQAPHQATGTIDGRLLYYNDKNIAAIMLL